MAVTKEYLSMDEYFRFTDGDKMIINHLSYIDSDDMELIQNKLTTIYDSDTISMVPSCDCGAVKGRYLLGIECEECSSKCSDPKERTKPVLWFEALDKGIPFINPAFWSAVSKTMAKKVDYLRWLSDPSYNPPGVIPNYVILALKEIMGGKRDYRVLVSMLDKLLDYFVNSTEFKSKPAYQNMVGIRDIYKEHKSDILSSYLPVFNKRLFVIENTTKGKYTNLVLGDIIDAITLWLKACDESTTPDKRAIVTSSLISKLSDLYLKYYDKFLFGKSGSFRKHLYGARAGFTFRTVIAASKGKHKHNDIIPPWVVLVTTFRPHVLNKLVNRGYSYRQADKLLNGSINHFDPVIKEIHDELIAESPYEEGIPVLAGRNPTLLQGSVQAMFIPRFNVNVKVLTTEHSPLAAKACNADFDGD